MKTRNGFVSNSSTSSFVVLGIKHQCDFDDLERLEKKIEEVGLDVLTDDGDFVYIGKTIADFSDEDGLEAGSIEIDTTELATKLKQLNLDEKIKIYYGTRAS
jgi:hypothetical protein